MKKEAEVFKEIESSLKLVAKTGKIIYGTDYVKWALKNKRVKLVVLSSNTPSEIERELRTLCESKNIPIFKSRRTNIELGRVCLRPHIITTLAILDLGILAQRVEEIA